MLCFRASRVRTGQGDNTPCGKGETVGEAVLVIIGIVLVCAFLGTVFDSGSGSSSSKDKDKDGGAGGSGGGCGGCGGGCGGCGG